MGLSFGKIDMNQEAPLREKIFFGIILLLLVTTFFRVLWAPKGNEIDKESVKITNLYSQVKTLEKFLNIEFPKRLNLKSKDLLDIKQIKSLLGEKGEAHAEVADLIGLLGNDEILSGARLLSIDSMPLIEKEGFNMIPVQFILKGRFSSIARYFRKIEELNKPLNIDRLEVTSKPEDGNLLTASVRANLFISSGITPQILE